MKLLFVPRDKYGCGWYRIRQPAKHLQMRGHTVDVCTNEGDDIPSNEKLKTYDLVFMQDHGSQEGNNLLYRAKMLGIPTVCDIDDFYHHIQPSNPGFASWNPATLYTYRTVECLQNCDAIISATPALAREYFLYCPKMYIVPNYIDRDLWSVPLKTKNDDIVRIGWAGGQAHIADLRMLKYVVEDLVHEYDGKVKFETMGIGEKDMKTVFNLKLRKDKCESCGFEGEVHYQLGEEIQNYPQVLASFGWDIVVAPIINNSFNIMKSDLKYKEYCTLGLPGVYSKVEPYIRSIKEGETGFLAETYEDWKNYLKELIDNPDTRRKIAHNARKESDNFWIEDNIWRMEKIFQEVISNKREKKDGTK